MTKYIKLKEIPKLAFAHTRRRENYSYKYVPNYHGVGVTCLEITYIVEGALEVVFDDGKTITAPEKSILCNTHKSAIRINCKGMHEHHTVGFVFPDCYADEEAVDALCIPFMLLPSEDGRILRLINEIIEINTMHTKGALACSGLFLQLLEIINRSTRNLDDFNPSNYSRYIKTTKKYVYNHIYEPIQQGDIAEHLGISPEHLCKVFKKYEGIPLIQYINRIKLERIRFLMENEKFTLAKAAALYGYTDPNYVSRLYKKYFGCNITDFKNESSDNF